MLKTFLVGIFLGLAATAGALYAIPVVDQHREMSIVAVAPNGGNIESFHINIPMDRVMVGAADAEASMPAGLQWPAEAVLANVSTEVFKVRNARDTVVGVAARTVAREEELDVISWMVHLPARGSVFINMATTPEENGNRIGEILAGSREFEPLVGFVAERWAADTSGEVDAPVGRIELLATYVSKSVPTDSSDFEEEKEPTQ